MAQTDLKKHAALSADESSQRHDSDSSTNKSCVQEETSYAGGRQIKGDPTLDRSSQKVKKDPSAREREADHAESALTQNVGDISALTTEQDLEATSNSELETLRIQRSTGQDDGHSSFDPLTPVYSLQFWEPLVRELHELTKDGYNKSSESGSNEMLETVFKKMEELREGFLTLDDKIVKLQAEKIAAKCNFMTSIASFMAQVYKALSNGYEVQCLLDWQLLLVTWTNCCEDMRRKVIAENIHIEMIKMLLDLPKSATYQELLSRLIHMGMFVLLTLIEQNNLRHHFKNCNYTDILVTYLQAKNFSIAKLARISTAILHRQLDRSTAEKHLALSTRDVEIIFKILSDTALSESETMEFWHYFSKGGLINSLKNFCCLSKNCATIVNCNGVQLIANLMQKSDTDIQEATLSLLWQLSSSCHDIIVKDNCDLDCLQELTSSDNEDVKCLATCLLACFNKSFPDGRSCILYVTTAYKNEMFEECAEVCQRVKQIHQDLNSDVINEINLYQGKSVYHIFSQDLIYLKRNPADTQYGTQKSACYKSIKQVIQLLGSVLDSGCIDEEGSQMLDTAMMMLLSESRNLKGDLPRCLLCRKKGKLARSHICPKAILSDFAKACGSPDSGKAFFYNWPWQKMLQGSLKSSGEITIRILCSSCESLLSKDEGLFLPNFFRKLYDVKNPNSIEEEHCVEYESWLYQFCVGIVFRGLVLQYSGGRDEFLNEDEVYTLFVQCRKVLLNHDTENGPCVSIYVAPTKGDPSEIGSSLINTVIHHPFHFFFTHKQGVYGSHQVFLHALSYTFQIGIILITINLPMAYWSVDPSQIISPTSGTILIPASAQRRRMIPSALWETLLASAMQLEKEVMEQPIKTIAMLPLDELLSIPPTSYMEGILCEAMKSEGVGKGSFLRGHPKIINLMPPFFVVNHPTFKNTSGSLELPHNHKVLLHLDISGENLQEGNTAFIAVGENVPDYGLENPYLIFHRYQPGLQENTAFIFSPNTYEFVRHLPERNPKRFLDKSESSSLLKKSKEIISLVLQSRGFRSYHSLLYWLHSKQ